jgi:hypothetical protein
MNIIEKRIDDLIMYENNPKIHTDEQIDKIAKSIELTKGLRQPIVIDKNNVIVVGHGRVQAAMQLGLETVPCELADDLTEEEIRAYRLIDNELAKGESDLDLLEQELASFNDIDMGEFFDDDDEFADIKADDFGDSFSLPDGDKPEIVKMTFMLHNEQKGLIDYAMSLVTDDVQETFGNTNKNGNALYEVVRQWAEQRKS